MVRTEHDIAAQVQAAKTDPEAADGFIQQYMGFIRSETVKFIHTAPENGHEDELSIALLAFYEAILAYEKNRGAFLPYAARAIRNRLIDHYRVEKRRGNVISLHMPLDTEDDGAELLDTIPDTVDHAEEYEVRAASQQEIQEFSEKLSGFGLTFSDVADNCPRQERTFAACRRVLDFARSRPELLKRLVMEAPDAIRWLNELGVMFDKDETGRMITTHGGGTSRKRMHACRDYSGAEIMRTLRDEVVNRGIPVAEFTSAVELIKDDKGQAAGAVLLNMETGEYLTARAKTVIIATGGAGRLHYQGFPTSNHYGATADGLILGYRAGVPLLYQDTIQYHPTGAAYPAQIFGALVTEKVRSLGAMLVNVEGEAFIHPLETRDVAAAGIIRECRSRNKGVPVPEGYGVWLDTPMIELIHGEGTIEKRIPAMLRMFLNYGIDMRKMPILVYPTLHYQNGGLEINGEGYTKTIGNLLVAIYQKYRTSHSKKEDSHGR